MFDDKEGFFKFIVGFIIITIIAGAVIMIIILSSIAISNVLFECGHINCSYKYNTGIAVYESNS